MELCNTVFLVKKYILSKGIIRIIKELFIHIYMYIYAYKNVHIYMHIIYSILIGLYMFNII